MPSLKERIKLIFEGKISEGIAPEPEQIFLAYSTNDGQQVEIDNLAVGGKVTLQDGTPVPAGQITLADGNLVTIGENGIISALGNQIQPPAQPSAPAVGTTPPAQRMEEEKEPDTEQAFVSKETFAALEEKLKAQDEKILALEKLINEKAANSEKAITLLSESFEEAKVAPSAEPVGKKKVLVEKVDTTNRFIKNFANLKS